MVTDGRLFPLLTLLVISFEVFLQIEQAKRGKKIELKKLAAMNVFDEIVGRAVEMGRPIHFSSGIGDVAGSSTSARTLGGLEILSIVAKRAASYDAKLIASMCQPTTYAVAEEMCKQAYIEAGHPERFGPGVVRFLSTAQYAYASSASSIIVNEKCAGNILIGSFGAESLMLAEAGNMVNAIQLGGDTIATQIPFFVVACDYTLIGEEIFAGGAYASGDPVGLGSLAAQDFGKVVAVCIAVAGLIFKWFGSPIFTDLMKR